MSANASKGYSRSVVSGVRGSVEIGLGEAGRYQPRLKSPATGNQDEPAPVHVNWESALP
jgi:hypothetical protein